VDLLGFKKYKQYPMLLEPVSADVAALILSVEGVL
jgi:hypothetical protein